MSNRLDELFKGKLAEHATRPSADAWGRVRERLSKKNRIPWTLRLAAALLLLCAVTATIIWWSSVNSTGQLPATSKKNTAPTKELEKAQSLNPQQASATQPNVAKRAPAAKVVKQSNPNPTLEINKEPLRVEPVPEAPAVTPVVTSTVVPEKPIVLEYRLESIQNPAVAASEKEKSGFKKVIDFAMEVKHSDGPGGLRQAKDELFALNFIKDKQKNHK